ncbi:2-methylcitrate dehydratase [Prauserella muralis]|uniref:2-methylcitrate dehydratase n=1 Tax=Prauserella muralis TaxID=588067 RepID=A0A2V4AJ21_9PSEU|nr:2-methylcitrate dehydratase [Prauserella muralis]
MHTVRQRLVDTLGCGLGALTAEPSRAARRLARALPPGPSTVLGTDDSTTADVAAFVNGTMVRHLDFNDGYLGLEPGHPSDNIPACLAVAEAEGRSGRDLVTAIALAYEVQVRLQDAANLYRRGWDHANYVLVSAALAAGTLMGLDARQLAQAVNIALNGHIALRQVRAGQLSAWKSSSAPNAARNGVFAAWLAREGFTGPAPIFEGEMGFMRQVSGSFTLEPPTFPRTAGSTYAVCRTLTKLLPTNGEMQTAVWAALAVRERIPDLRAVERIVVDTTDIGWTILGKDPEKWRPSTRETADHSLPYTVARVLVDGTLTPSSYDPDALADPVVGALLDRVEVREDPALTAMLPERIPNRVTVRLASGEEFVREVRDAPGGRRTPMTDEQFEEKFTTLVRPLASERRCRRMLDAIWTIDRAATVSALTGVLAVDGEDATREGL